VNDFVRPESMEVPDGGLASFLTATVGEWADDDVPHNGIAGLHNVADKLAEYGRYEDTYMVHAAEGETVIPMAVFDENPRLKESLFNQMRAMGIDPERYVVGSELNSINPVTGQPEFFLKKLFKGLKKAVKKVIRVVKKVAPIALSIGLNFVPGVGPILAASLGSGIGTLIQGGDLKDALKMGAIGGLTAGLFKGIQGGFRGMKAGQGFGTGFGAGVRSGLPGAAPYNPVAAQLNQNAAQAAQAKLPVTQPPAGSLSVSPTGAGVPQGTVSATHIPPGGQVNTAGLPVGPVQGAPQVTGPPTASSNLSTDMWANTKPGFLPQNVNPQGDVVGAQTTGDSLAQLSRQAQTTGADVKAPTVTSGIETTATGTTTADALGQIQKPPGFFSSVKDMFTPGGDDFFTAGRKAFFPSSYTPEEILRAELGLTTEATVGEVMQKAAQTEGLQGLGYRDLLAAFGNAEGYNPGLGRTWGPLAGAGILGLAATGGFKPPEMEEAPDPFDLGGQGAWDLLAANPQKYRVFAGGAPYNLTASPYGAAQGGYTSDFPRRDGAISGPGTGTSDDIPAMLSDGEFVMTERAVRGAGNGDRGQGVRKMYEIMRTYEGVA